MKSALPFFTKNYALASLHLLLMQVVFAFRPAEGMLPALTPAPATKYIFYWGTVQCDLTDANDYKGAISVTPAEFRRMLLSTPRLWNGKSLVPDFSFKFEGNRVNTADYVSEIAGLDTNYGQNVVAGQVFNITGLQLDERTEGAVRLSIRKPEPEKENARLGVWQSPPASYLNGRLLERVIWGREDIYDTPNRDFFTTNEFWQTVRQLPVIEWKRHANPAPVSVSIQFSDLGGSNFGLAAPLEDESYRRMLNNLENYRHLVKAGSAISLILKTTEQHEELFQRRMMLVPDNDPRLALRRNSDAHTLKFRWGAWEDKIEHLYLQRFTGPAGERQPVDQPVGRASGWPRADALEMIRIRPELWIDDQKIPDFSYRISSDSVSVRLGPGDSMPDSLGPEIRSGTRERGTIQLDSFQIPGFDLPPVSLFLNYFDLNNRLLVRNDFDALSVMRGSVRIKLNPPVFEKNDLFFDFVLPEQVRIALSVFEADGRTVFLLEDTFTAGRHTANVPRSAFRRTGKHICFLNTPFGVVKQEFEMTGE